MDKVLKQARDLKIKDISLTGGEVVLHPQLEELLEMIAHHNFRFNMMTNGLNFKEKLLPLLMNPKIGRKNGEVCFSLDGATSATHDALRGQGSFKEVMEAAMLCKMKGITFGLKSTVSAINRGGINELIMLGATLGAIHHNFIALIPTPRLIKEKIILSPREIEATFANIMRGPANAVKTKIQIDAYCPPTVVFWCNAFHTPNIDYHGNLTFCCTLSHITNDTKPSVLGDEFLADLNKEPLSTGISRHFQSLALLMSDRIKEAVHLSPITYNPCYWCLKHFNKLTWLKNYPESPWAAGVLDDSNNK